MREVNVSMENSPPFREFSLRYAAEWVVRWGLVCDWINTIRSCTARCKYRTQDGVWIEVRRVHQPHEERKLNRTVYWIHHPSQSPTYVHSLVFPPFLSSLIYFSWEKNTYIYLFFKHQFQKYKILIKTSAGWME